MLVVADKLIVGYPGNGKAPWDGWVELPGPDGDGAVASAYSGECNWTQKQR